MKCKKCSYDNNGNAKFCESCGAKLEEIQNVKVEEQIKGNSIPKKPRKSKGFVISIIALILIVGGFLGYTYYNANNVKKSIIKSDLIGQKISVGRNTITLSDGNIESIKIINKKTSIQDGMKMSEIDGHVEVENEHYKVEAPFKMEYVYNRRDSVLGKKGWLLWNGRVLNNKDEIVYEFKSKPTEDEFKNSIIGEKVQGKTITEDMLVISSIEENKESATFTAKVAIKDAGVLISQSIKLEVESYYNEGKWEFNSPTNIQNVVEIKEGKVEITLEDFKKEMIKISDKDSIKYETGNYFENTRIDLNNITQIENVQVVKNSEGKKISYTVNANIKAVRDEKNYDGLLEVKIDESSRYGQFILAKDKTKKDDFTSRFKQVQSAWGEDLNAYMSKKSTAECFDYMLNRYEAWDKFLNEIWAELKVTMDETKFKELTDVQLEWIKVKENKIKQSEENLAGREDRYRLIDLNRALGDDTKARCLELINGYM